MHFSVNSLTSKNTLKLGKFSKVTAKPKDTRKKSWNLKSSKVWNGEVTSLISLCWKIELGTKIFTHQHFERHVLEAFSIFSTQVSLQVWDMSTSKTSCMRIKRKPPTSPQYIQIRLKETDGGMSNELTIRAEIETNNYIVVCYKITKIVRAFWLVKNPWFIVPVNS